MSTVSEDPAATAGSQELVEELFESRRKIHPRSVSGVFATWRWITVAVTQLVFYGLPWLRWGSRPAILFDLDARKFYIFGYIFWPQDFIYLALILLLCAFGLFWWTAIAGRLWCGYACPQTVYTSIFLWIEEKVEGSPNARRKLDEAPMSAHKLSRRGGKHVLWLLFSLWTGFTFVSYFTPIATLAHETEGVNIGPWELFWIGFYGLATYGNAGFLREQVCKYMCPYARFQSAMFDRDTLTISYDAARGEPRGSRKRGAEPAQLGLGSCVDCGICVQVCPTGIDIRQGLQYECIGCAACIDACDQVMVKMNYPKGLIRYTTENALERPGWQWPRHIIRTRVVIYSLLLLAIGTTLVVSVALRDPLRMDVIRDRLVRETDTGLESVYQLVLINADERTHRVGLSVAGVPGMRLLSDAALPITLAPAATQRFTVRVEIPDSAHLPPGPHRIVFTAQALDNPRLQRREKAALIVPKEQP